MPGTSDRRPLASRSAGWAQALARRLSATRITPNQISQSSLLFALLAGAGFALAGETEGGARWLCLLAAALGCQLRLLCNLLDGMVAVEGGKATPDGPFWNEATDRASDIVILVGAGLGAGMAWLGWTAAAFAILTAYFRELGRGCGLAPDFGGPMAKPQRMATMTVAALAALAAPAAFALQIGLWIAAAGAALTAALRALRLIAKLKERG